MPLQIQDGQFYHNGQPWTAMGANYFVPGTGWAPQFWQQFNATRARTDMELLAGLGGNCARVFCTWSQFMDAPDRINEQAMAKLEALLDIGEQTGVLIHPTGPDHWEGTPDWARASRYADPTVGAAQEVFWKHLAGRFGDHPGLMAWDLLNEPVIAMEARGIPEAWAAWTAQQDTPLPDQPPLGEDLPEPTLAAVTAFRMHLHRQWVARQVEAIRSTGTAGLVTCGYIQYALPILGPFAGTHLADAAELLDFLSFHFYPAKPVDTPEEMDFYLTAAEILARTCAALGRPVLLAEFGYPGGNTETKPWWKTHPCPPTPESASTAWCQKLIERTAGLVAGWLCWGLYDMPEAKDITECTGLLDRDGQVKDWGKAFARLAGSLAGKLEPRDPGPLRPLDFTRAVSDGKDALASAVDTFQKSGPFAYDLQHRPAGRGVQ